MSDMAKFVQIAVANDLHDPEESLLLYALDEDGEVWTRYGGMWLLVGNEREEIHRDS